MQDYNSKVLRIFIFFFLLSVNVLNAQESLMGKSYTALLSTSCKEFVDGGCTIRSYCTLSFDKKVVHVSYSVEANCTPIQREKLYEDNLQNPNRTVPYSLHNKTINISAFSDFSSFRFVDNAVIVKKEIEGKSEDIIFLELKK